ncbi:polymer-forming cytoskeletal protein [Candidatus Nomurabacteria bacterium]|nr:polymer-forming cytoskeletal protein [Candidatus Nomurabacteria bacterium]MCB9819243.1 polymer-forming cytoskeletal protein [Candidatus Nomurabacteria bacterium]
MKNYFERIRSPQIAFVAMLTLILIPSIVSAETVVRTGNSVSIGVSQIVENDFYASAGSVTHSGEVREDMYVVAGSVTINGPIGADLTALGGTVQVNAPIGDDVRVMGGEVVISGEVKGDVFVIGGLLKVLSSATINGGIYFYGGEAEIEGVVKGSVMGRAESITISGEVGAVDVSAVNITLGDRANVRGDLSYASVRELERAAGAVVEGDILRGTVAEEDNRGNASLIFVLSWIFTTLCVFLIFRTRFGELLDEIKRDTARVGLIGLATFFIAPLLSFILLATVLGAWLGILTLLSTLLLFLVSWIILPILLGGYIMSYLMKGRRIDLLSVLVGVFTLIFLSYIPVIGGLLIFLSFVLVLGSLLQKLYVAFRSLT